MGQFVVANTRAVKSRWARRDGEITFKARSNEKSQEGPVRWVNPWAVPTYPELCLCPTPTDFLRVPENEHHTTGLVVSTLLLVFIRRCSLNSLLSLTSPLTPTEPVKHGEDHRTATKSQTQFSVEILYHAEMRWKKIRPFPASAGLLCTYAVSVFQKWLLYICTLIHRRALVKNKTIQL